MNEKRELCGQHISTSVSPFFLKKLINYAATAGSRNCVNKKCALNFPRKDVSGVEKKRGQYYFSTAYAITHFLLHNLCGCLCYHLRASNLLSVSQQFSPFLGLLSSENETPFISKPFKFSSFSIVCTFLQNSKLDFISIT